MTMTVVPGDLVIYSASASIPATPTRRHGDFMATVKVTADKKLEAQYRFRWHRTHDKLDMDGGADDDEKSFWEVQPPDPTDTPETRAKLIATLRKILQQPGFANVEEFEGEWTAEQFVTEVLDKSRMRYQITPERKT